MLRHFLGGMALGAAFPGLLPGLFIAIPVFFAGIYFLIAPVTILNSFNLHPAFTITLGLGLLFVILKAVSWAAARFPMGSAIGLGLIIGGFYGLMAYNIFDGDRIWVAAIAIASAAYTFRKFYSHNLVEAASRLGGTANAY